MFTASRCFCFSHSVFVGIALILGGMLCSPVAAFGAASPEEAGASVSVPAASTQADGSRADRPAEKDASLPAGVSESWWSQVQRRIAEEEYHFSPWHPEDTSDAAVPAGWQAPNRSQNLRARFTAEGLAVAPRVTPDSGGWLLGLKLREVSGYPGWSERVELSAEGNRLRYLRGAGVEEWYENRPEGLEQGFTLHRPPVSGDTVSVELEVGGGLRPALEGTEIALYDGSGARVLHYGKLRVVDASGRELPSSMSVTPDGHIRLDAEVSGAVYPVVIDPLLTAPAWTAEGNQAYALFGNSVTTAGDVNGDGYSDVIVGAPYYDNGQTDEGRAFVYYGSASGLSAAPDWTAESDQANARFGYSVATAGDVNGDGYSDVIVGAPYYDNGETDEGRAFVYYGSALGLSAAPDWTAESDQANARFGRSVATAGDVNGDGYSDVIVGAYWYDNGQTDEGRAYVYYGSASGLSAAPGWTAESDQDTARFGYSVSTAGDVNGDGYSDVIVGAYYYDDGVEGGEGWAFVYYGSAWGLSATPNWTAEGNQLSANFGWSVSTAGDVNGDGYSDVIVGAYRYENGQSGEGGAFVYYGSASGLSAAPDWTAESDQVTALLGFSVSTAGDVNGDGYSDVIVGAISYDNGQSNEGSTFLYYGNGEAGGGLALRPRMRRQDVGLGLNYAAYEPASPDAPPG